MLLGSVLLLPLSASAVPCVASMGVVPLDQALYATGSFANATCVPDNAFNEFIGDVLIEGARFCLLTTTVYSVGPILGDMVKLI